MSKAARIRQLAKQGLSIGEISRQVVAELGPPCSEEYVRVCARQRANGWLSTAEANWRAKNPEWFEQYHSAYRERRRAAQEAPT